MHICIICGEPATLGDSLCDDHEQLADLWSAVNGGLLSDWPNVRLNPQYHHITMMRQPRALALTGWQAELHWITYHSAGWLEDNDHSE